MHSSKFVSKSKSEPLACFKFYSLSKIAISKINKQSLGLGGLVRLPTLDRRIKVRKSPSGDGYATFCSRYTRIYRCLGLIYDVNNLKRINSKPLPSGVFYQCKVY